MILIVLLAQKRGDSIAEIQVYMIKHNQTGRMYIGRSWNVERRVKSHFSSLRNGRHPVEDMQEDFDKYGDDYTVTILGEEGANNTEIKKMDKYRSTTRGIGYNYNDPQVTSKGRTKRACSTKGLIIKLLNRMSESELLYTYTLLSKIFEVNKNE